MRKSALKVAVRRSGQGYSPAFEGKQAEAELRAATQLVPQVRLAIARQENALSILTGATPGAIARGQAFEDLPLPEVPGFLPSELLRRRPDVLAAEAQIVASDAALDASRAASMPSLRLSASGYIKVECPACKSVVLNLVRGGRASSGRRICDLVFDLIGVTPLVHSVVRGSFH